MGDRTLLQAALDAGAVTPADLHLARHVAALDPAAPEPLELLVALASARVREGDVCLRPADDPFLERLGLRLDPAALAQWSLVGRPGERGRPLVLEGDRLYLARYHAWERQVIAGVARLLAAPPPPVDEARLKRGLERCFSGCSGEVDWQRVAAALALTRRFSIISGGPGTGKTWTVARILELLLEQPGSHDLRVAMAAPTGKAAGRLTESLAGAGAGLAQRVGKAVTLHRLLGMRPGRIDPAYGPGRPLPVDLLVVDEVSMVDLPMMARLLQALPREAGLLLLGDHHQLASVEAGQVMGDLCGQGAGSYSAGTARQLEALTGYPLPVASPSPPPMADHLVVLRRSRRFHPEHGVGRLAAAVNRGDAAGTLQALREEAPAVRWLPAEPASLQALLQQRVVPLFRAIRQGLSPAEALARLDEVRVLCAVREGPQGVRHLNAVVEGALGESRGDLYHGQPVMVTVNDPGQQLFNGDIGLVLRDGQGRPRVWFRDGETGVRSLLPGRLPPHETVYAMTIHKSQGSEFDEVVLVLPGEESPLVTRELLYTGITRARRRVTLCASEAAVRQAVGRTVRRVGGLHAAIWRTNPGQGTRPGA